jgi:hypothetical protein
MIIDLGSRPCDLCSGGYAEPTMPTGSYVIHPHHGACRNGMSEHQRRCFDALMLIDAFTDTYKDDRMMPWTFLERLSSTLKGDAG